MEKAGSTWITRPYPRSQSAQLGVLKAAPNISNASVFFNMI
jgi:hypothetical protein